MEEFYHEQHQIDVIDILDLNQRLLMARLESAYSMIWGTHQMADV